MTHNEELEYYTSQGPISDPGDLRRMIKNLPSDMEPLCKTIQGVMIHAHWAESYGRKLSDAEAREPELRHVHKQLHRIKEIDSTALTYPRPVTQKLAGTCRDFALMLTTFLREQNVPARARCGFGGYFEKDKYVDHWVCEYWNADQQRWILVDAQLDQFQQDTLKLPFDPLDVPRDRFLVAGKAWQLCRDNQLDPEKFGIFDRWGMWFIKGNVIRDLASLNKVELLPWDVWGLMSEEETKGSDPGIELWDRIAEITSVKSWSFEAIRSIYIQNDDLKVPGTIKSYSNNGPQFIEL